MANMMNIPVLGLVENMSYATCPDCGKQIKVFGESHIDEIAAAKELPVLGRIPIDPKLAAACDAGMLELFDGNWLDGLAEKLAVMAEE
ncbi:MAG: P-loop NTPase, partial [Angelakisella sp.]